MMAGEITENLVGVDELLQTLASSCLEVANHVDLVSNSARLDHPVRYTVPAFRVNVKLSFTKTGNEVKGVLFWKQSEGFSSESLSEIEMQIVAVPRAPS
jgi:hypothetical protein